MRAPLCVLCALALLVLPTRREAGPDPRTQPQTEADRELVRAARAGDTAAMIAAFRRGAYAERRDPEGRSPIWHAVEANQPAAVHMLINVGADTCRVLVGKGLLHVALPGARIEIIRDLVRAGCDVLQADTQGRTPYAMAESAGRADVIGLFRESLRNSWGPRGRIWMMLAAGYSCGPPKYATLAEALKTLSGFGAHFDAAFTGSIATCAGCRCPSSLHYFARINFFDEKAAASVGWKRAPDGLVREALQVSGAAP